MNAKHGYLTCMIHIVSVALCLMSARSCPISLFSFKFGLNLRSAEMSIRMQANLYKRLTITYKGLTITTNVLPSIRMTYDCSRICCEYVFLKNFRSMFLIFIRSRECLRTPTNFLRSLRIGIFYKIIISNIASQPCMHDMTKHSDISNFQCFNKIDENCLEGDPMVYVGADLI